MADLETSLKIKFDNEFERKSRTAFSADPVKALKKSAKELRDEFGQLLKVQADLSIAMRGVARGSKEFKELGERVKDVASHVGTLRDLLKSIDQLQQKSSSRAGRQGFIGGLASGLGIAHYVPSGPGQIPRIGGALLGGGISRAVGAGMAPFANPGLGGIASMLNAVPFIGGAMGGALTTAQSYWQEAVSFQRSRLANIPYMNDVMGRAGNIRTRLALALPPPTSEVGLAGVKGKGGIAEDPNWSSGAKNDRWSGRNRNMATEAYQGFKAWWDATPETQRRMAYSDAWVRKGGAEQELARKPPEGGLLAWRHRQLNPNAPAAESLRERVTKTDAASQRAAAAQDMANAQPMMGPYVRKVTSGFGKIELPSAGVGARLGYMPEEVQGMFGQFMNARGGVAEKGSFAKSTFRESMVLSRAFGIGPETSGGYYKMFGAGGGGMAASQQTLSQTVAAGMAMGLKGSRLVEYTQMLVNQGRRAEQQGLKMDVGGYVESMMAMRSVGVSGAQSSRIVAGLTSYAQNVSFTGVTKPMDMMLMRAAGYNPEEGPESYARTKNKLSRGVDLTTMTNLFKGIGEGAGAGGVGPEMKIMRTRNALESMGVRIGPELASAIGGFGRGEMSIEDLAKRAQEQDVGKWLTRAETVTGQVGGGAKQEASLSASRIAAGGKFGGLVGEAQRAQIAAVNAMSVFAGDLKGLAGVVRKAASAMGEAFKKFKTVSGP